MVDLVAGDARLMSEAIGGRDTWSGQPISFHDRAMRLAVGGMGATISVLSSAVTGNPGTGIAARESIKTGGKWLGRMSSKAIYGTHDAYAGVKEASRYLKKMGVSRADRVRWLQSFDVATIKMMQASESAYAIRFHDFGNKADPMGQFLLETITPLTNRMHLALPPQFNGMTGISQWQLKTGSIYMKGRIAPQTKFGPQYIGGADQLFVLQPWKYQTLLKL